MEQEIDVGRHLDQLGEAAGALPADLLWWAVVALVVFVGLLIAYKLFTGDKKKPVKQAPDLTIDIMALGSEGPPSGAPVLEFYNIPVRLAAVVLAPAGRVRALPPDENLEETYEALLPGLAEVVAAHRPLIFCWPPQMSVRGFAHAMFQHCRLPGDGGKGSPWCTAAGVFKIKGQPLMAGLVLLSSQPTSYGQHTMETPEVWLGCLRVKRA